MVAQRYKFRFSRQQWIAPGLLLLAYGATQLVGPDYLPVSAIVLSALAYLAGIWGRSLLLTSRGDYGLSRRSQLLIGLSVAAFGIVWTGVNLIVNSDLLAQRMFTVGPLAMGLFWLLLRNDEDIQKDRFTWRWGYLNSHRFRSYAATVHGTGLLFQAGINEIAIAIGNDLLWILSCGLTPIFIKWAFSHLIVRGLLQRGAQMRRASNAT